VINRDNPFCEPEQRRYVLIAAILASALGFIDGTVVSIAMPAMRSSLGASLSEAQWISNAYMLMLSALILVGGGAGDRFGVRRTFAAGIAVFVIASLACAVAPTASWLIAARVAQGFGAAFMVPGSLAIISKAYPRQERGRAIGIWAAASAVTTAAGPLLGGVLLSWGNNEIWRLIFAINLPLGALALYFLLAKVPTDPHNDASGLDILGALFAVVMLGALAWALTGKEGEGGGLVIQHVVPYLLLAAACFAAFLFVEARAKHPLVPPAIFSEPVFAATNVATFFLYFALSAILFFLPMALIAGWGLPEQQVGLVYLPLSAAIALLSSFVGRLSDRVGPGRLIAAGSFITGLAFAGLALGMQLQSFWGHVFPMMMLMGLGMGLVVSPLSTAVMAAVSEQEQGVASGINNAVSRVAGLLAVAAMGTLAGAIYPLFGARVETQFVAQHLAGSNEAFQYVAAICALMCFAAAVIAAVGIQTPDPE
jgi:EmrB/QacA subfamily drug resistance transporter